MLLPTTRITCTALVYTTREQISYYCNARYNQAAKPVGGLNSNAGVTSKFDGVKPLDQDLMKITGAQEPSRIPHIAPIFESKGPNRGSRKTRPNSSAHRRRPY